MEKNTTTPTVKQRQIIERIVSRWGQNRIHSLDISEWSTYDLEFLYRKKIFIRIDWYNGLIWGSLNHEVLNF
jgi:hypothetical protein